MPMAAVARRLPRFPSHRRLRCLLRAAWFHSFCVDGCHMRHKNIARRAVFGACAVLSACFAFGQEKSKSSSSTPLMGQLYRFTAAGVPALGPAEAEVAPRKWDQPIPAGL